MWCIEKLYKGKEIIKIKSKDRHLLEKSIQATLCAIEIYNKPDFKYREESFCILIVNAWEILLKAKIIADNQGNLNSIFIIDNTAKKENEDSYNKQKYKKNKVGNELTFDISTCLEKIKNIDDTLKENIKLLVQIRNNAIHFYNESKLFENKMLGIVIATLKSYVQCIKDWFDYDLSSKYNFYLMPISFFHLEEVESFSVHNEDTQYKNILKYIETKEQENPFDETKKHNISLVLKTKFVRSKADDAEKVKIDPNAEKSIKIDSEDQFKNKYPWNYTDHLLPKLKKRYTDFIQSKEFYHLKKKLEQNEKYCGIRYLDWNKKTSSTKKFYSSDILQEFDKHYSKK